MSGNFSGTFEHNLDSKNRLFMPADFKAVIDGKITMRLSISKYPHIDCFKEEEFEDVVKKEVENSKLTISPDAIDSISRSYAKTVSIDNGGRICIASKLLEKAGITKESIFVGKGNHFQIWDPDIHDKYNDYLFDCVLADSEAEDAERIMNNKFRSEGMFLEPKNTIGSK